MAVRPPLNARLTAAAEVLGITSTTLLNHPDHVRATEAALDAAAALGIPDLRRRLHLIGDTEYLRRLG